jgi:pectate lyase
MATATDSFTYSDGVLNTVSSGAWVNRANNWHQVTSGQVAPRDPSGTDVMSTWETNTFGDDQYSQAVAIARNNFPGVVCRWTSGTGTGNWYRLSWASATTVQLAKFTNGSFGAITTATVPSFTSGDVIRLECEGTNLRGYVNSTEYINTTDSSFTTGKVGIFGYHHGDILDTWEGGDLAAAGPEYIRMRVVRP